MLLKSSNSSFLLILRIHLLYTNCELMSWKQVQYNWFYLSMVVHIRATIKCHCEYYQNKSYSLGAVDRWQFWEISNLLNSRLLSKRDKFRKVLLLDLLQSWKQLVKWITSIMLKRARARDHDLKHHKNGPKKSICVSANIVNVYTVFRVL